MMQLSLNKMKPSNQISQGIIANELYQGLDLRALIGVSKEPALSIQEQIELGIKAEKQKIQSEQNELVQTRNLLNDLIETIKEERLAWVNAMHEELTTVVLASVKSLIEVELKTNPEIVKNAFGNLIKEIADQEVQTIVINQSDHESLQAQMGDELISFLEKSKITFDVKSDVPRGTLYACSKQLSIDAGIIEKVKRFLFEAEGQK